MRDNIAIFSHNTHSFIKNEIYSAADKFKRVVVITPYDKEIEKVTKEFKHVEYYVFNKNDIILSMLLNSKALLDKSKRLELKDAYKNKKISRLYLKKYLSFIALEKTLKDIIVKKVKVTKENSGKWILYSAWYFGTANAIGMIKKSYPKIKTVSLAHSFEVDSEKNPYTKLLFRKSYHKYLNKVSFISTNVFNMYNREIATPLNLELTNTDVTYLGTKKILDGISKHSNDGVIRILSCSHVVPVKRVELILKSLQNLSNQNVEWTHIGDGPELNQIKKQVENNKNKLLKVNLLGSITNAEIHQFIVNNPIDVFINVSISEGIPVTIMEAIAYGVPVVATDVGGNSEIVKPEFGRIITKNPNYEEINSAILDIYEQSEYVKLNMKKDAMEFYQKHFNSETIRSKFFKKIIED